MLKISSDGAVLTKKKHGVQGTIRVLQVDASGKPLQKSTLPLRFQKEILLFYYIGTRIFLVSTLIGLCTKFHG